MPWYVRAGLVILGSVPVGLLVIAATLTPETQGFGTHQQLGLPPCTFKELTGIRCPSCGMTTSWSHMMHGQVVGALRANVGGTLLAAIAAAAGPWIIASGIHGAWLGRFPSEWTSLTVGVSLMGITLIDWAVRWLMGW